MAVEHGPETVCIAQERYCVDRQTFAQVGAALGVAASTIRRWAEQGHWDEERKAIALAEAEIRANTVKARALALKKLMEAQNHQESSQAVAVVSALERLALDRMALERLGQVRPNTDTLLTERMAIPGRAGNAALEADKCKRTRAKTAKKTTLSKEPGLSVAALAQNDKEDGASEEATLCARTLSDEERSVLLEEAVNRQLAYVLAHPVDDLAKRIKEIKAALDVLATIKGKDVRASAITVSFAEEDQCQSQE